MQVTGCQAHVRNERDARDGSAGTSGRPRLGRGPRRSMHAGTRKMVNYAWAGRSRGKPRWRPAAVLTCKSIVKPGHRGERLIEPSSSWFPPKFPSG